MRADSARLSRPPTEAPKPAARKIAPPTAALGHLAPIALAAGAGLLVCSLANALSRATLAPSPLLYWAGILLIALPIFYRLTSREASPRERFALVCLLGLSLYAVKVVRDAPLFNFSDELVHAFNANQIVDRHHLFHANSIISVTPHYPGLEGATSALMSITGLGSFWAGVIVVGAARLALVVAMFFLFIRLSGSARIAGLGVAIYTGNFNFLFWGAQYSYESLALPLLVVIMLALAEREAAPRQRAREWAVPVVLGTLAIVITHHLTSYALVVFIAALALGHWLLRKSWNWPNPWKFAVLAAALALAWLLLAADSTFGYLSPVLGEAFEAVFNTASGEAPPRGLFQGSGSAIPSTPLGARAVALLAVAILTVGLPFGLRTIWPRYRKQPFVILLTLAALGFFGTLALRLAPQAWETGNRLSEFLFIGLAFVLAGVGLERWRPKGRPWAGRALLAGFLGIVLVGGAISGWPWDIQLARPERASAEGRTIVSPPLAMAEWAKDQVEGGRFAAPVADARLLLDPGDHVAFAGKSPDIVDVVENAALEGWEIPLLRENDLRYVVIDRRELAADGIRGYFFTSHGAGFDEELLPKSTATKFDAVPGAERIYDNGPIAVYDLGGKR
jgi:hypothetical protein